MSRKKKPEERKWRFYWQNINGLGRFNRFVWGLLMLGLAVAVKDDRKKAIPAALIGMDLIVAGLLKWCPLRAILKRPTRRARKRHFPKGA